MRDAKCTWVRLALVVVWAMFWGTSGGLLAQENPLGQVKTQTPPPAPKAPVDPNPPVVGADGQPLTTGIKTSRLHVETNLVLVPVTVTDPVGRLVTGLERENFQVFDNNVGQTIKSFSTDDAPISIGIIFDLSGSMSTKFLRARKALTDFLRTSNPQDEFFVVGFNDRPAVIVDYTSDVDDVEARMVMMKPENRTALIDACSSSPMAAITAAATPRASSAGSCGRAICRSIPSASSTSTRPPKRSRWDPSCCPTSAR
jgi:Ca-activated chloride channel family protein